MPAAYQEIERTLTGDGWHTTDDERDVGSNVRRRTSLSKPFGDWTGEAEILIVDPPQRFTTKDGTEMSYGLELSLSAPTGKSC